MKKADGWVIWWGNHWSEDSVYVNDVTNMRKTTANIDEAEVFSSFDAAMSCLLNSTYTAGQKQAGYNSGYRVKPYELLPPTPRRRLLDE